MSEIKYGYLTIEKNDGHCVITGCDKNATTVVLPEEIDGVAVVEIAPHAFEYCTQLESVVFPEKTPESSDGFLYEIGANAFLGCSALKKISIPHYVDSVGHGAFYLCTALEEVEHSDCYFYAYSFSGCTALKKIPPVSCINEGIFQDCSALDHLPVTDDCIGFDEDAFRGCTGLTEVVIPAAVKYMEPCVFRSCYNLKRAIFRCPDKWHYEDGYGKKVYIDFDDPEKSAKWLSTMDFDDGVYISRD